MFKKIMNWTEKIINENNTVITIAAKRRSKYEHWLKYQLAKEIYINLTEEINIEFSNENIKRCDLAFNMNNDKYYVELKTPNTNWRIDKIEKLRKPRTKNRDGIINDILKLRKSGVSNGIICFILSPIPPKDDRWKIFVSEIEEKSGQIIDIKRNCRVIKIIREDLRFEVLICCFKVDKEKK